ncbi:phage holin family protein [Paenibacillus pinihumi]|uniref:phage holin family protein n=1 Tax=Paenibacillus pinihumi TaxID=669462 RepID=UPI0004245210|nr:phage holin family protein [Paenibacillus pinihumi]
MEWNIIFELIDPRLMVVVAACWILGVALKHTPGVPSWSIIYHVIIAAILLSVWLIGFGPESVIQGVLAGAFAVFGHQFVKQAKEARTNDKDV